MAANDAIPATNAKGATDQNTVGTIQHVADSA